MTCRQLAEHARHGWDDLGAAWIQGWLETRRHREMRGGTCNTSPPAVPDLVTRVFGRSSVLGASAWRRVGSLPFRSRRQHGFKGYPASMPSGARIALPHSRNSSSSPAGSRSSYRERAPSTANGCSLGGVPYRKRWTSVVHGAWILKGHQFERRC